MLLKKTPNKGRHLEIIVTKYVYLSLQKGKGKSGGARVITHIQIVRKKVYLLSIYDKSEQSDIDDKDLNNLINLIP